MLKRGGNYCMNKIVEDTMQERTGTRSLEVSKWMRKSLKKSRLGLNISDIDTVLDEYNQKKIMLIEFKTHGKDITWAQRQTFGRLNKIMKAGSSVINYEYRGFFVIRLSGECPETSEEIYIRDVSVINGDYLITKEELTKFMNFEIDINL
jgi:hypothetical protein